MKLSRDTPEPQTLPRKVLHGQPSKSQRQEALALRLAIFHAPTGLSATEPLLTNHSRPVLALLIFLLSFSMAF